MKKMLSCIMAIMTMFTCINIGSVKASETTEHEHTWVETTEIVHHDAEYATKTTWFQWGTWLTTLENGTLPEGPNKYHINYNGAVYEKYTDMYDLYCWRYETLDNVPEEFILKWITIDNYENYGLTYDEFCSKTETYSIFGDLNPEFNPEYDELVNISSGLVGEVVFGENGLKDQGICKKVRTAGREYPDGTTPYYPAAQEQICVNETYDETIVHHICTVCGESYDSIQEEPETIKGDINNDGAFNVSDVVLLQKWLLTVPDVKLENWKAADFCKDDRLDVFDLCLMKRYLLSQEVFV